MKQGPYQDKTQATRYFVRIYHYNKNIKDFLMGHKLRIWQ